VFLWFGGFSILLFLLSKTQPIEQILLISITIVSAIRICSYFTEELSRDLAKLLPLSLLAIAIVEPNFFSTTLFFERISELPNFIAEIIRFVFFTILLEWALRIILRVKIFLIGDRTIQPLNFNEKEKM
jgi:hypothetical protein